MRKWLVILCVAAQVSVLAFMVFSREMIIHTGQQIYLRTAPLDPRDIFRGDFVRLDYAFNTVSSRNAQNLTAARKGQVVYASLQSQPGGVYAFTSLSATRPDDGVFLRGRITRNRRWADAGTLSVKYGIEQYFVEQGSGIAIEERRGRRGDMQVPMEVAVALSSKGVAVLKDFRWSALGIQVEVQQIEAQEPTGQTAVTATPRSPLLKVTLENVSQQPLQLANPGDNCAFSLVADSRSRRKYTAADKSCENSVAGPQSLVNLSPGEQYSVELDLSAPRFHLSTQDDNGEVTTGEIAVLPANNRYRIVYQFPTAGAANGNAAVTTNQEDTPDLWPGQLPSQAFFAGGRID